MKKYYLSFKIKFFMLIVSIFFFSSVLNANTIKINKAAKTDLKVNVNTYEKLSVINTISNINFFDIKTEKGAFTEFSISKYSYTSKTGSPKLPVVRKLIELPFGAQIKINILNFKVKEYKLEDLGIDNKIIPTQPSAPKSGIIPDFQFNESSYNVNSFYPNKIADVDILGIMRGTRIGRLNISPVQYNPVTNTIKVYTEIEVEISFENADIAKTLKNKEKNNSQYFNTTFSKLLNYKRPNNAKDTLSKYPIKYVIVSDPMFHNQLQPFINWKKKKGFNVVEAYTDNSSVGNTTSSIKAYLQGLYESSTVYDPAPTFVLFVGDVAQVPAFSGTEGSHVTDLFYCEYSNDYLPEVYYGRFSARDLDELQPQIDKTLEYEQFLFPDPTYLNEVVMISGVDDSHAPTYGNGQITYGTTYYFNEAHGLTSHTFLYPESGSASTQIHQLVSDGVAYANYTAHGSPSGWYNPSFTVSDIPALENEHKYPLMVGNCCQTSTYDDANCFAEALLRADKKGALGYIGASNSSYWDEDFYWGVGVGSITANPTYEGTTLGAYDRTFHDHNEQYSEWYNTMDEMVFAGNLAVTEGSSSRYKYYWETYCLMGDPSLMVYFSAPADLTANYNIIPLGVSSITVNTEPYAYVAISKDNVLYGAALADNNGLAQVNITPFTQPGNANLVITKQNFKPLITTVLVSGAPGQATNANPMDGQNQVSPFTSLNWEDGLGGESTSYTLYFGTNNPPTNIANGITLTDTFYIPSSGLDYYTQYFWRVDSHNGYGDVTGNVWNFSVIYPPDDGFESGDFSANSWYFDGDADWTIDNNTKFQGLFSAKSGAITDSNTSTLKIDCTSSAFNSVSFWYKVSSEQDGDKLVFYIDGTQKEEWSGDIDWTYLKQAVPPGTHTLEWKYIKNEANEAGDDCAWVDNIYLPVDHAFLSVSAGDDATICEGSIYTTTANAENYSSLLWETSGDGTFENTTILNPVYTPGDNDIENASVVLTITAENLQGNSISESMTLFINPAPFVSAGNDSTICQGVDFTLDAVAENYDSISWTTTGDGTFNDSTLLTAVYTPGEQDIINGSINLTIFVNGISPCSDVSDEMILTIDPLPTTPEIPEGADTVDLAYVTITSYTVNTANFASEYLWTLYPVEAGSLSSELNNATILWSVDYLGDAYIKVKGINDCGESDFSDSLKVHIENTVGINNLSKAEKINLYPNPNTGIFRLLINDAKKVESIRIYNSIGSLVFEDNKIASEYSKDINLSNLPNGVYYLSVNKENNNAVFKKIIIQK